MNFLSHNNVEDFPLPTLPSLSTYNNINHIDRNCNRLDILINKEPAARRANAKYRVDQLKYDLKHVQVSSQLVLAKF